MYKGEPNSACKTYCILTFIHPFSLLTPILHGLVAASVLLKFRFTFVIIITASSTTNYKYLRTNAVIWGKLYLPLSLFVAFLLRRLTNIKYSLSLLKSINIGLLCHCRLLTFCMFLDILATPTEAIFSRLCLLYTSNGL